jgi:hypothetical protein
VKNYISKFLKCVALAYMAFPATYLLAIAILFDVPMGNLPGVLASPVFYLASAAAVSAGYGLWEMKRWAWHFLIAASVLIAYENAIVLHQYAESHHKALAYIASLMGVAGILHRVSREVRVPYFFPKIRWWESNPRYKLCVPVKVTRSVPGETGPPTVLEAEILDLSMGGCFLKLRTDLAYHQRVVLSFKVFGVPVECDGAVVWLTQSRVTHPRGCGIKFALANRGQKRALKQITSRLKKIANLYRRSRYLMTQEEFIKRLDELENRGVSA